MEFGLSEFQIQLQDSLNRFLFERAPLDRVREWAESDDHFPADVWSGLAELGVPGVLVPEAYGGVGLEALDASVIAECLGNHVTPAPFLGTSVVAAQAIALGGNDEQKNSFLPEIAAGNRIVGTAISELAAARSTAGVTCRERLLTGEAQFVTDPGAEFYLVGDQEYRLYLVDGNAHGLGLKAMPNIDRTRRLCALQFEQVKAELLPGSEDPRLTRSIIDLARVTLSADTIGASQSMLDQAVAYSKDRTQFNRQIGSFQAVKHMCADMVAELEPARSLMWYASYALDHDGEQSHLAACHAKAHASEVGTFVAKTATVVHGGMGFTDMLGLHYWFKRIGYNRQYLGGPDQIREEAADLQDLT